ncbi:MAG: FprA family A-type flavoprotein [Planctomycetes bacterium]|nr:FprA family A-type flavoprotein [Planctomycetota bacterium]
MDQVFTAQQVTDHVYWVGAVDWSIRDFHGYSTSRGTSYNAFLILGDEPILVDTVKAPFRDEMFQRIASVIEPSSIRHVISNHSEMDHSGCLPDVIERIRPRTVFASAKGAEALARHFGLSGVQAVADGQAMTLGGAELRFYETRMLHWPDSMFTYYAADRVLFSSDAFGMHLAGTQRFTDEMPWDVVEQECAKYYANILLPFSKLVLKLVGRLEELALPLKVIACDHGPIWREGLDRIVELYVKWATQAPTRKAVVVYDTMWGSTARMAQAVVEGLVAGGAWAKVLPMGGSHRSDVATEILDAGALLVGTPTLNQNLFPTLADVLTYLKGLAPKNLVGGAFGSYGWSSKAVGQVADALEAMGVEAVAEPVESAYVPDAQVLQRCRALGRAVAGRLAAFGGDGA